MNDIDTRYTRIFEQIWIFANNRTIVDILCEYLNLANIRTLVNTIASLATNYFKASNSNSRHHKSTADPRTIYNKLIKKRYTLILNKRTVQLKLGTPY